MAVGGRIAQGPEFTACDTVRQDKGIAAQHVDVVKAEQAQAVVEAVDAAVPRLDLALSATGHEASGADGTGPRPAVLRRWRTASSVPWPAGVAFQTATVLK